MFDGTSRYYALETIVITRPDGTSIAYKARRFLPDPNTMQTVAEVEFTQGDRLDRLTARTIGVAESFWQICDANRVLNPRELEQQGRRIRIALPTGASR